jgi:hexosaminidase
MPWNDDMNLRVLPILACCLLLPALPTCASDTPPMLPAPAWSQATQEGFVPGQRLLINLGGNEALRANAQWLAALPGSTLATGVSDGDEGDIRLHRVDATALSAAFAAAGLAPPDQINEAYRLQVGPGGVDIRAVGDAGLFYGLVSLWQLVSALPAGTHTWPGLDLLDAPVFAWRGLLLDSARHMQSVAFIKRYLDAMALHKLSVLHWHLTDDQAWRLDINRYPRLAQIGGFRVPAGAAPAADIDPATSQPRLYGGYYTQDQVREIVAYAAARHITVVPEIGMPGHASAAIAAYPELGVDGFTVDEVPASWGVYDNVFNLDEVTFQFLEGVLEEVVALFPGPYLHLGGDEVVTSQWQASAQTAARMRELGIEQLGAVKNHFVERMQSYLAAHDKRVVGWDEILESAIPADAVVMSWRGIDGAIEAVKRGHQAILSPAPILYLDHLQTAAADAPPGRGGVITVRDIYGFDPLPASLQVQARQVLGLQGNLWTEHIRTEARADYMTWPRAAAIAELGWTPAARRDWDSFAQRLALDLPRLAALGIAAATDPQALGAAPAGPSATNRREDRELQLCSQAIVLALEDDAPLSGERESFLVDIQDPCWIWRDVPVQSLVGIRTAIGQLPFNFEIGDSLQHVVVEPPGAAGSALRVRLGNCDGAVIAEVPVAAASGNDAVTELPLASVQLPAGTGATADLCFRFTREGVAPMWVIDWVELVRATQ